MKVKIHVGKKHIDTADYGSPESCMVANAIREQLETGDSIEPFIGIEEGSNYLTSERGSIFIKLPQWVKSRIQRWDRYEDRNEYLDDGSEIRAKARTKPFEFEFELPDDWREQLTGKKP